MKGARSEIGEDYLSQVAHELRGSLNAILGWAELLRRAECDDAARIRAAETIARHARQQSAMLTELIDTWRLSVGTLALASGAVDVLWVVQDAVAAVQPAADARTVRLETRLDPTASRLANGDAKRLSQALTALLLNAVHFAPEGSVVRLLMTGDAESVHLTIRDEGPTVPPSALPYLFERNHPPDRSSARGNFRLGLSLVRDVIARHGGSIQAETEASGAGLTFHVMLPLETPAAGAVRHPATLVERTDGVDGQIQLAGLRVLLVDDEPDAREALTTILELHGAVVHGAGSAADAIAALQHDPFDVLLADIGMPGADGYDLIRYVRGLETSSASQMPAAAVTAFASDADRRRALDAGFQVHLSKPVDPAALVATVAVLGRPRAALR
jgi:CheY-like chemotaxis protein